MLDVLDKRLDTKAQTQSGLTIGDVIAMLETFDPALPLLVAGEYGGLEAVLGFRKIHVRLNVNEAEGFGPHEVAEPGERPDLSAVTLRVAQR